MEKAEQLRISEHGDSMVVIEKQEGEDGDDEAAENKE